MSITIAPATLTAAAAYLAAVNAPGVNVVDVRWTSTVKPAAAHKSRVLTKVVTAKVMTGLSYADLSVNNDRVTGDLPWGIWLTFPWLIVHKGETFARLYTVDDTVKVEGYFVDGEPVAREDFLAMLTPSARETKRPNGGCITVKSANLTVL